MGRSCMCANASLSPQLLRFAARGTSQYLLFLPLLSAMGLHTSKMLGHVWPSGGEPPVPAGVGLSCSLPSTCVWTWVHKHEYQGLHLSAERCATSCCGLSESGIPYFVSKGTLQALVKCSVLFCWNAILEGSWVCVCCFLCDIATK